MATVSGNGARDSTLLSGQHAADVILRAREALAALDFSGKIVWRKEIVPYSFAVTVGSSPVLYKETILVFCAMAKPESSSNNNRSLRVMRIVYSGFGSVLA